LKTEYLPGFTLDAYQQFMATRFPQFFDTLWLDRAGIDEAIHFMNTGPADFESNQGGGRGNSYQKAQQNPLVRSTGITKLIDLALKQDGTRRPSAAPKILDILGGDGTIARALQCMPTKDRIDQAILTSDISACMVLKAINYDLPTVRQPAQFLFLRDMSFDSVIIAYGTHHIPAHDIVSVCKEAHRVLKPGGRIVIHDFEEQSPVARWFQEVVDTYSYTGHQYPHFTTHQFEDYLKASGFRDVNVFRMYDPFIVRDETEQGAYEKLMDYILHMYGLHKLHEGTQHPNEAYARVHHLINQYMIYEYSDMPERQSGWKEKLTFYKAEQFVAEMPRLALVAVGTK
jgi:ubiquinone/menaquinone biosynthesis C-methylase UbiE